MKRMASVCLLATTLWMGCDTTTTVGGGDDLSTHEASDLACPQPQAPCVTGRDYASCTDGAWRPCMNCGIGWKCDNCGHNTCAADVDINGGDGGK